MNPKPWFSSKLNWQGILRMIGGIALYLAGDAFIKEYAAMLIPVLIFIDGIIQMVLRTFYTRLEIARSFSGAVPPAQQMRVEQELRQAL